MIEHVILSDGTELWKENNQIHNEKCPAKIGSDGGEFWYKNNRPHRIQAPSKLRPNGTEFWITHGHDHRENAAAAIYAKTGIELWFQNDMITRIINIPSSNIFLGSGVNGVTEIDNGEIERFIPILVYIDLMDE